MKPKLFKLISFVVFLSMLFTPVSAGPQWLVANNQQPVSGASGQTMGKIDPVVLSEIQSQGATDFFIWMAAQADVSAAKQLTTKLEKGEFVFERLRLFAEQSQKDLRAFLDSQKVDYQPFYIANTILVKAVDQNLLLDIAARPDVAAILPNRSYQLQEPFIIDPDPPETLGVEPNITFIKATDVWAMGINGEGTVMAGGDTGLQWDHPAIKEHYRGWDGMNVDHNYNWWDATGTYPMIPGDGHGHGTHITGTMVGDDGGANQIGVAPGAKTIHCKNMTDWGSGDDGTFITCFQWILAPWDLNGQNPDPDMAPDSMNNSWGYWGGGVPQFETIISNLHAAGILVEVSAGNEGPYCGSLRSPGDYEQVLTTGSVNHASGVLPGTLTDWSSRGPSSLYPDDFFPDIMAPGENIRSSLPGNTYASWSGTSMAGPHAAALIGLMWSANPALAGFVDETIQMIKDTAVPLTGVGGSGCGGDYVTGPNNDWGNGTIDALAAVNAAIDFGGTGTLQGTVTEAGSGDPIVGVKIMAVGPYNRSTTTNPLGEYSLLSPAGTYDVTASKYGYISQTVTSVEILEGQTYTLDFTLELADFYNVSGVVTDTNTGWPLYARIDITGYPYSPVWTNPQTGEYSLDLAGGFEYTFHVNAWVDGYLTSSRPVGPLSGDAVEDFSLEPDLFTCIAPGYSFDYLYYEDFESDDGGYTIEGPSPAPWQWGIPLTWPGECADGVSCWGTNLTGNYNDNADQSIVSPIFDLSSAPPDQNLLARWHQALHIEDAWFDKAYAEYRIDGGPWQTMWEHNEGTIKVPWTEKVYDVSAAAGSTLQFRFRFTSDSSVVYDGYYIDAVGIVAGEDCQPLPGSLIVGNVYDANTGLGLVKAVVSSDLGYSTITKATPHDPGVDDGFYTLFGPEGTNELTASKANYNPDSAVVIVGDGETVRQDFELAAGYLQVDPDSISIDVLFGTSEIIQIDLNNLGDVEAEFEIMEIDSGFIPVGAPVQVFVPAPAGAAPQGTAAQFGLTKTPGRQAWSYLDSNQPAVGETDVLIVYADDGDAEPLRSILQAYPDIGVVDIWNAADWGNGIPNLETLLEYPVVITWSNYPYADRKAMGNVLADYVDAGGYVIQSPFNWVDDSWWGLGGRFVDEGYSPFVNINGGNRENYSSLGVYDPTHPLMEGVTTASDFFRDIVDLDPDATLVASWADGEEFVAYKDNVVAINSYTGIYYMWTGDVGMIFHNAVNFLVLGRDVAWLSADPTAGTVPPLDTHVIEVTLDASVPEVTQPGLYNASLRFRNDTPYGPLDLPVTMNVTPTETMGKLLGTITSQGYCDENPYPLAGATVLVESSLGASWELKTNVEGYFQLWLEQSHSPLTITITHPVHEGDSATGLIIVGQELTPVEFSLRWLGPCLSVDTDSLAVQVPVGHELVAGLNLTNSGGGSASFSIRERPVVGSGLSTETLVQVPATGGPIPGGTAAAQSGLTAVPDKASWSYLDTNLPTTRQTKVLIVYADDGGGEPLRAILRAYPDISVVDTWLARESDGSIPPLSVLDEYDVVITWANFAYADRIAMGDMLADYVDGGGTVIQSVFNWTDNYYWGLGGRFVDEGYSPFININGGNHYYDASLGDFDLSHPLMDGVLEASDYFRDIVDLDLDATLVASWDDGEEFVAFKNNVVAINAYPGKYFMWTGDIGIIFHNAVNFLMDGLEVPWLSVDPATGVVPADDTYTVNVIFSALEQLEVGQVYHATLKINSSDPVNRLIQIPITMTVVEVEYIRYLPLVFKD